MKDTAIAVYIDNVENVITEFSWLYNSWLVSGSWRTSRIIAFHHPDISHDDLPIDNDIEYLHLLPLTVTEPEWSNYPFINSIWYMTVPEAAVLANYKYVLKTDCDCFLTPYFPNLRPRLAQFGAGMFANDPSVVIRLAEIARKWGIYPVFNNVGSTFMASGNMALQYMQTQFEYCKKLKAEEFTDGYGKWPGWYQGVLTMYAGQLAANAIFCTNMYIGGLDVHCMALEQMSPQDYHIHAWHTTGYFSKHSWRQGEYRNRDMTALDKTTIADYCLWLTGPGPEVTK